jgi:glycosyltransferase involved in cell wall biosynthesis
MAPLLSIVIPAYNSAKYIHSTLSMLDSQGLEDCEVIIVNDGSTDDTEKICKTFTLDHSNIRLISLEINSGVSVARNTGLNEAKGKYICFLDSDDTFTPNTLSIFKESIRKHGGHDVFCFGYEVQRNGKVIKKHLYRKYSGMTFGGTFDFLKLELEKRISCIMGSILISHELLRLNKIFFRPGMKIGEDLEFFLRIFLSSDSVYYDSRICCVYCIREDSATKGYKGYSIHQLNAYLIIAEYLQELIARNSDLSKSGYFYLANLYVANLYFYLKSNVRDNTINKFFLNNKTILYKNYWGQIPRLILFYMLRIIPIRLFFYIFHKKSSVK